MYSKSAITLLEHQEKEIFHLCSPAVGFFTSAVDEGYPVSNGSSLGELNILGKRVSLVLPPGYKGKILAKKANNKDALAYGTLLFVAELASSKQEDLQEQMEGMIPVRSPMAGVFYRRGAPDQPCFVNEGDIVSLGTTLGLVEQMKSFNRISFQGDSSITLGKVVRILVEDQSEVDNGTPLFLIKPVSEEEKS